MKQKSYIFRAYPTEEQKEIINYNIGATRYFSNYLRSRLLNYDKKKLRYPNKTEVINFINEAKLKHPFLNKADTSSLILRGKEIFISFLNHRKYPNYYKLPKHKNKKYIGKYSSMNYLSYSSSIDNSIKIKGLGDLAINKYREIPKNYSHQMTIIEKIGSKYYANVVFEYEPNEINYKINFRNIIGLDFSLKNFYVDSNGNIPSFPFKKLTILYKRARRLEKRLRKKKKESSNYIKTINLISETYVKIDRIRKYYHYLIIKSLLSSYDVIAIENLDINKIMNKENNYNGYLLRFGSRCSMIGYSTFIYLLNKKAEEQGKRVIKVEKDFKSSQICSSCGYVNPNLKDIAIREYRCPKCNNIIDRDINAAINIKNRVLNNLGIK